MNKLKEKLQRDEVVIKVVPRFRSAREIRFIGTLGFDAVFLDAEHSNLTIDMIEDFAIAARASGLASIVRPEDNVRQLIIRYLDCDVDGIMVPHIDTPDDAKRMVDAASYGRFKDTSHGSGSTWGISDKLIIAMVESRKAVENLPDLLNVSGIDLFFIGPADLAMDMGHPGQHTHPEVMKAREYATEEILAAGKPVGTIGTFENINSLIATGVRYFVMPTTTFMMRGVKEFQQILQSREASRT